MFSIYTVLSIKWLLSYAIRRALTLPLSRSPVVFHHVCICAVTFVKLITLNWSVVKHYTLLVV